MAKRDDAPALLLQQLPSDAVALVGNDDLVAAARSALQHQTRVGASSPVPSSDMLEELQREAVELASPSKECPAPQLHSKYRYSSDYDEVALPSATDVRTLHREAALALHEAEHQAASEKNVALRAITLASDLGERCERLRHRIAQVSHAERWLREQLKEKDTQLQAMRAEAARLSDVERTLHEMGVHDGGTATVEHSLMEMGALVVESIGLGADAAVEEEREACRIAVRQEGVERGKRVLAEQLTAAYTAASEDLQRRAARVEALADEDNLKAESVARAIEETTRKIQRVREEAQATAASMIEQAAQMVGAPSRRMPESAPNSHWRARPTQNAWVAAGAHEISEDGVYEVALPHQAVAAWAEHEIAPNLEEARSLALAAQRDAAAAEAEANFSVASVCAATQKFGATAIDLDKSIMDLVAQHRHLEASVSVLQADQRIDAVLRSPAAMLHDCRRQQRRQWQRRQQAGGQGLDTVHSIDAVDRRIDAVLARAGRQHLSGGMQQVAGGMGVALHF